MFWNVSLGFNFDNHQKNKQKVHPILNSIKQYDFTYISRRNSVLFMKVIFIVKSQQVNLQRDSCDSRATKISSGRDEW
jgi:hypothetical protein